MVAGGEALALEPQDLAFSHAPDEQLPKPAGQAGTALLHPTSRPARSVSVFTARDVLRAPTYPTDRRIGSHMSSISLEAVADALAMATGEQGSTPEHLCSTVAHPEERGIQDAQPWKLQDLVPRRIQSMMVAAGVSQRILVPSDATGLPGLGRPMLVSRPAS